MDKGMIRIRGARQNNLQHINLDIPHNQMIVVTGVSGSGKSSLAFDIIAREGQRRYLETFSSFSRLYIGKISRPQVDLIEGLSPVITLSQKTVGNNSRSTVGTMSDLYDMLRLLFARLGKSKEKIPLSRSLFSFNSEKGACPVCKGLGLEEKISLEKLIAYPNRCIRDGALAPTQPNGYIMYSQVTVDVLNQLCKAHGFSTDIPWNQLTADQKKVILYGSTLLKVPFGKHPLESRLKWTGITAKPREEDYYKGIVTIMTDILRRDRNESILRFVESVPCNSCQGKRLNNTALGVSLNGKNIDQLCSLELSQLKNWLEEQQWDGKDTLIAKPVIGKMCAYITTMIDLGIGHLSLNRPAATLSGGESQRIRLINQVSAQLSNILYVFDEPTIGLHPAEKVPMLALLRQLVDAGNTVIVVEHDETTIKQADWIIDIGPAAGEHGGELIYNGKLTDFLNNHALSGISKTWDCLNTTVTPVNNRLKEGKNTIILENCQANNLKNISVKFLAAGVNVVCGVSGSGKASLVQNVLLDAVSRNIGGGVPPSHSSYKTYGLESLNKVITIDQSPIGRTPRSNPATYTGLADKIRDLFAKLPASAEAGFNKSHFSFNTAGGRCETCQGAGSQQIGMHFLGNVDVVCPDCNGKRFHENILSIKYKGKNIAEILDLTVDQARLFFTDKPLILKYLEIIQEVGLGYLHLGQASSTLSGGEAQRIKLAYELQQKGTGNTLYVFDEPTIGLHKADTQVLMQVFRRLAAHGNTVVCIDHDFEIINNADHIIELGPGSGINGGYLLFQGSPFELMNSKASLLKTFLTDQESVDVQHAPLHVPQDKIELSGVTTHYLKNIDVTFPRNKLTVVTGLSGSGKTSLVFDTLYAEAYNRYIESLSTYTRSLLQQSNPAEMTGSKGLGPVVAIGRTYSGHSSRSTVGTLTGLYDHYRLLFSRISQLSGHSFTARHFSFNNETGACTECKGLGYVLRCSPSKLITSPGKSIVNGAMDGHKTGLFYGDPYGQYIAILKTAAGEMRKDLSHPWNELKDDVRNIVLYGTGDKEYDVIWKYKNKTRQGEHHMKSSWQGFCSLIDDEYFRKHLNKNTRDIEDLMEELPCISCGGARLKQNLLEIRLSGLNIAELSALTVHESRVFFEQLSSSLHSEAVNNIVREIIPRVDDLLEVLHELGLSYMTIDRPSKSLSAGEGQRVRLAGALSAQLYGVTYVFDEPGKGLHHKDILPLIDIIKKLVDKGNTAVVIEHDEQFIRQADHIIELGPGSGLHGGELIFSGVLADLKPESHSVTLSWLQNPISIKGKERKVTDHAFGIYGANKHNLKNIDVSFIASGIIAITGVSGSGKSTLVHKVLYESAKRGVPVGCKSTFGLGNFNRILFVDQKPVGSNSLSTLATYSGLMDMLRPLFAATDDAKNSKLGLNAFSYLSKEGKCPDCNGYGKKRTSMDFMNDVWTSCDTCNGSRYQKGVLEVRLNNLTIAEILNLTLDEAAVIFISYIDLYKYLTLLQDVGIGYLKLGQSCDTLSGGEGQRLKLATELHYNKGNNNLYLFDEPSTGLHAFDIHKLVNLFNRIVDEGNTIMFIEHNQMLISLADQVITLGPGSGPNGGEVV